MESGSSRELGKIQSHSLSRGNLNVDVGEKGGADLEGIDCKMLRTGSDGVGTLRHSWTSDFVPRRITRLLRVLTKPGDMSQCGVRADRKERRKKAMTVLVCWQLGNHDRRMP